MVTLPKLFDFLSKPLRANTETRIHIDDPHAVFILTNRLTELLEASRLKEPPLILCIGTDRSTGDCLGPLTGWHLKKLLFNKQIQVLGTIDHPVHAQNLENTLAEIRDRDNDKPIIAIDACLGHLSHVGTILLENKPLRPGAGVNKILPEVGNISISGIVNVSGFMELQVLQNTRLSTVMKMSQIISNTIFLTLRRLNCLN